MYMVWVNSFTVLFLVSYYEINNHKNKNSASKFVKKFIFYKKTKFIWL